MFKDLLFQLVVIFLPMLFYYSFFNQDELKRNPMREKVLVCVFSIMSIILCMLFPVTFGNTTVLDLRTVPWLVSFLYGGPMVGIVVTIALVIFRLSLGITLGAFLAFFIYTFFAAIIVILVKGFRKKLTKTNTLILCLFTSILVVLFNYIFLFNFTLNNEQRAFFIFYIAIHMLTLFLVISVIEILEERIMLHQQMQLKEKQYIVGQLAASVAHEIRNPMTVIRGFLQLSHESKDSSQRKYTELMISELDRAETIINDYLSLAREEASTKDDIKVSDEVLRVNETLQSFALLKGVNVSVESMNENIYIYGNKQKFTQVLVNIIKNAIEASEGNGIVTIRTTNHHHKVWIEVIDNGIGMTDQQIRNLGIAFYSTKEKGTGLGLMVCYNIIESMNGKIEVESKRGEGSIFKIILPCSLKKEKLTS